jgi:hypothetical protein
MLSYNTMETLGMTISSKIDVTDFKSLSSFKRRQVSCAPSNLSVYTSSASTGDIFFDLPSASRSMLNGEASYLTFDIDVNGVAQTTGAGLSNGNAASVINLLEETIQNQTVSTLNNYNVYANLIYDLQSTTRQITFGSIMSGGDPVIHKKGASFGAGVGYNTSLRVSIPLHSAVFGVGQENFLPCVDGMRLRLSMAKTDDAITSVGAAVLNYRLQNIALKLEYLDIATDAMYRQLLDEAGGVFKVHGQAVANFQTSSAASSVQSFLIPARFSSVKSMFGCFRLSADIAAPALKNAVGCRCNPYIRDYTFNIDGVNKNPTPVRVDGGAGESIAELANCFNAVSSSEFTIAANAATYLQTDSSTTQGAFALGINFEEHSTTGAGAVVGGIDTNSSNTYLNITNTQAAGGYTCDFFAVYDLILSIDMINGGVSMSK